MKIEILNEDNMSIHKITRKDGDKIWICDIILSALKTKRNPILISSDDGSIVIIPNEKAQCYTYRMTP